MNYGTSLGNAKKVDQSPSILETGEVFGVITYCSNLEDGPILPIAVSLEGEE